ncbi:IucA/IucC family protein [Pilimelia terevasa]|uniref:IucA/IucC family protein n=1 Tax=Pilimelia terevasa TaxID=53372 RepID=UPI001E65A9B0|nr:IucA/IucC family protein [Pilimelia terevasa]
MTTTVGGGLHAAAPELADAVAAALPRAAATVRRRLLAALVREDVGDARERYGARGRWSGFGHVTFDDAPDVPFAALLPPGAAGLAAELEDAVVNQAVAYARAPGGPPPAAGPDAAVAAAERSATEGHNLHPCGRTRLGWSAADVLAHDLEGPGTAVGFVAVPAAAHRGDDLGALLRATRPQVPAAPPGHVVQPVHAWQWERLRRCRPDGVRLLDGRIGATATLAVRTLLLDGPPAYLKLSLDVLITSTRRTISPASAANGPGISALLEEVLGRDAAGARALLLREPAAAAAPGVGDGRAASAILREPLAGRLEPGEAVWPATALAVPDAAGRPAAARLVAAYARRGGAADGPAAAAAWLAAYAELLLAPVLRLATAYGVGLEAHLQNCLPTFVDGVPHRMVFRDLAGLRLHRPRLAAAGLSVALHPDSVVGTDDVAVLRAKVCYTAFQAHLAELVRQVCGAYGLAEDGVWARVREVVDGLAGGTADHGAWTAPTVPHKALVRMRLAGGGDLYVPVSNPLCRSGR